MDNTAIEPNVASLTAMDPTASAALLQMQQQLQQQMQQQFAAMQAQLTQQLQPVPTPVIEPRSAAPRVDRPRLPAPPSYDGRSASALDGWMAKLQQQFDWYGMNDDSARLQFATALLDGSALDWWSSLVEANGAPQSALTRPATYEGFVARLRARFQPIDSAQTARSKLDALRQGAKQSTNEYIAAFRTLLVRTPNMGEEDRVHRFIAGLRPAIATQLRVHGVATLDAAITMAARVGSIAEHGAANSHALASAAAAAVPRNDAMDLSNVEGLEADNTSDEPAVVSRAEYNALLNAMKQMRSKQGPKNSAGPRDVVAEMMQRHKMTKEQVRKHFDEKLCFNCSQPGHSSRNCTHSKQGK